MAATAERVHKCECEIWPPRYRQAKLGMALRMPGVEVPFP